MKGEDRMEEKMEANELKSIYNTNKEKKEWEGKKQGVKCCLKFNQEQRKSGFKRTDYDIEMM